MTVLWLSDPDTTAHANGIGHPTSVAALRAVDEEIARIQDGLRAAERLHAFNIWVTSDHGFSTHTGAVDLDALLAPFAGEQPDGSPRIVAGSGAIYVRDGDAGAVAGIVEALQGSDRVGAIFTRDARLPGTLAFDAARWDHARSADILYSPAWTDAENEHGYRGTSASGGTAGHGSTSPYDIHNTLIRGGSGAAVRDRGRAADLQRRLRADVPLPARVERRAHDGRAAVDRGLPRRPGAGGRAALVGDRDGTLTPDGRYGRATARSTVVLGRRYLDSATLPSVGRRSRGAKSRRVTPAHPSVLAFVAASPVMCRFPFLQIATADR